MNEALAPMRQSFAMLVRILVDPTSNMRVALLLYATIALILLLVLAVGTMYVMGTPDDRPTTTTTTEKRRTTAGKAPRKPKRLSGRTRALLAVGAVVVILAVWVFAGFTTSDPGLCKSCHWPAAQHAKADAATDPHTRVACVSCHETGGALGRYVTGVPFRVLHLGMAWAGSGSDTGYGQATSQACASCHAKTLAVTSINADRGLKVSHAEPMAASAGCTDCHAMSNGTVSVHNRGMTPCLRCHDDKSASSACATCHTEKAAAARARTTSFQGVQIRDVKCGGCHNEKRDCDPCHGARMPHSSDFLGHAHARAAAVDIWFNHGNGCRRCHTAQRRPCTRCHSSLIGKGHGVPSGLATSHQHAQSASCNTCHQKYASIATRDFCKDVCHDAAAIAASPR